MADALVLNPDDLDVSAGSGTDELDALLTLTGPPSVVLPARELAETRELIEAIWEEQKHPRWPKGTKGADGKDIGGLFMRVGQQFLDGKGRRWEIMHVADGHIIAHDASGDLSQTETKVFSPTSATIDGEKVPVIKGATVAPLYPLTAGTSHDGEHYSGGNTPIADAVVHPGTEKGDTFSFEGGKMVVTNVLKKDGHVKAKLAKAGAHVQNFPPDHPALASLFRPDDYALGGKGKVGEMPPGALVSGSPVAKHPYMVLGTLGKKTALLNLDSGEVVQVGQGKSYPMLLHGSAVEDGPQVPGAKAGDPHPGWAIGDQVPSEDFVVGDKFSTLASDKASYEWTVIEATPSTNMVTVQNASTHNKTTVGKSSTATFYYKGHEGAAEAPVAATTAAPVGPLPDAVTDGSFQAFKSGFGPGGKYKHDKLQDFSEGSVLLDKTGKPWVVKQTGSQPIVSDGHQNFSIDGGLPEPDGVTQNAAGDTLKQLGLLPGDQLFGYGKWWTVQTASAQGTVTVDDDGNTKLFPAFWSPSEYVGADADGWHQGHGKSAGELGLKKDDQFVGAHSGATYTLTADPEGDGQTAPAGKSGTVSTWASKYKKAAPATDDDWVPVVGSQSVNDLGLGVGDTFVSKGGSKSKSKLKIVDGQPGQWTVQGDDGMPAVLAGTIKVATFKKGTPEPTSVLPGVMLSHAEMPDGTIYKTPLGSIVQQLGANAAGGYKLKMIKPKPTQGTSPAGTIWDATNFEPAQKYEVVELPATSPAAWTNLPPDTDPTTLNLTVGDQFVDTDGDVHEVMGFKGGELDTKWQPAGDPDNPAPEENLWHHGLTWGEGELQATKVLYQAGHPAVPPGEDVQAGGKFAPGTKVKAGDLQIGDVLNAAPGGGDWKIVGDYPGEKTAWKVLLDGSDGMIFKKTAVWFAHGPSGEQAKPQTFKPYQPKVTTNKNVVDAFIGGEEATNSTGSLWSKLEPDGSIALHSYNTPIAIRKNDTTYLTNASPSATTGKHKGLVKAAFDGWVKWDKAAKGKGLKMTSQSGLDIMLADAQKSHAGDFPSLPPDEPMVGDVVDGSQLKVGDFFSNAAATGVWKVLSADGKHVVWQKTKATGGTGIKGHSSVSSLGKVQLVSNPDPKSDSKMAPKDMPVGTVFQGATGVVKKVGDLPGGEVKVEMVEPNGKAEKVAGDQWESVAGWGKTPKEIVPWTTPKQTAMTPKLVSNPEAKLVDVPQSDGIVQLPGKFTPTESAGGTTGAMWTQDITAGVPWIYKDYSGNHDRVASEALANAIYQKLGVSVAAGGIAHDPKGNPVFVAPKVPGDVDSGEWSEAQKHALAQDYVADALLANYDVIGLDRDNILWNGDQPTRVDQGGTFQYRAQGKLKPYAPMPSELWSMLTKGQAGANGLGEHLSEQDLRVQAAKVAALLPPSVTDGLVASAPFADEQMKQQVKDALVKRVGWLKDFGAGKYGLPADVQKLLAQHAGNVPVGGVQASSISQMPLTPYGSKHGHGGKFIYPAIEDVKVGTAFRDKDGNKFFVTGHPPGLPYTQVKAIATGVLVEVPHKFTDAKGVTKPTRVKLVPDSGSGSVMGA